jgi:hypothetical protein
VVCFGAGVGLGYFLARRRKGDLHVLPQPEPFDIEEVKDFIEKHEPEKSVEIERYTETEEITVIEDDDPLSSVELTVPEKDFGVKPEVEETVKKFIEEQDKKRFAPKPQGAEMATLKPIVQPEPEEEEVEQNIFANNGDSDWDYKEEQRRRSELAPYVLHKDEFFADEKDYTQITLTYYAGDDILTDEDDKPIYNHRSIVGDMKFGHGSGDPNVFYVRNDKNRAEYEILLHEGLYSVEVLGLEIENNQRARDIKHSEHTKFRME